MTAAGATVGQRRFTHIDALRAVAVLFVVLGHAGLSGFISAGSGVTMFFSISGFIITYLVVREQDRTGRFAIGRFYLRRALKIGPPLLLIVVVPSLVYAVARPLSWTGFGSQVLFSYNWLEAYGGGKGVLPGSGVTWSLAIEEQFYILFALLWVCTARYRRARRILAAAAVTAILWATVARFLLAVSAVGISDRIYYGSDTRVDGLAWGILAALCLHAWQRGGDLLPRLRRLVSTDAALAAAAVVYVLSVGIRDEWFRNTLRYTLQSLATCTVILYGFQSSRTPLRRAFDWTTGWRWVQWIGLASYSIYLIHVPVLGPLSPVLRDVPVPVAIVLAIVVGVAAGLVVYRVVEVPFERLRRRLHREDDVGAAADRPRAERRPARTPATAAVPPPRSSGDAAPRTDDLGAVRAEDGHG